MSKSRALLRLAASAVASIALMLGPVAVGHTASIEAQMGEPVITDVTTWGFTPKVLRARVGDMVTWTNSGAVTHTVTARGVFDSGLMAPGTRFSLTPSTPGTFPYLCTLHQFMEATLVIEPAAAPVPASAPRISGCQFVLGFAAIREQIGAQVVGDCLENEGHNPENGDALQRTSGGLLVWRKADNVTAFTDGNSTWVNGPFGLQRRLNTEKFPWER